MSSVNATVLNPRRAFGTPTPLHRPASLKDRAGTLKVIRFALLRSRATPLGNRPGMIQHRILSCASFVVLESYAMSCAGLKELEATCDQYAERRHSTVQAEAERRSQPMGTRRAGQFQMAYTIMVHRQNCGACRCDFSS